MIPYGCQDVDDSDLEAVVTALKSDFLTQGPRVPEFENAVSGYCSAQFATAVNSATSALHIACLALDVGPADLVWTSPISFVASANCALYCGAKVDFVDVDPTTGNMSVSALAEKLARAKSENALPKVVIPVHLCGESCDMAGIGRLAKSYGFRVIEDASHAIGATCGSRAVGACEHSDIVVFSFHPVKIITSAEGGMVVTNDADLHSKLQMLRSHGVTRDPDLMAWPADGPWSYQQVSLGFNYRLTDLQAALGTSQLKRISHFIDRRHELADRYDELLGNMEVQPLLRNQFGQSSLHLYVVLLDDGFVPSRRQVFEKMRSGGVGVNIHYIPIHTQPYYQELGFSVGMFPGSEAYYARAITLPLHPKLSLEDQNRVVELLGEALN
ncbi:MAG: UDP-4-amino-4,6-dideoxy-N-acetyl-beta-L-altrosamine transaminase [Rhizobiaceae bacterium]